MRRWVSPRYLNKVRNRVEAGGLPYGASIFVINILRCLIIGHLIDSHGSVQSCFKRPFDTLAFFKTSTKY